LSELDTLDVGRGLSIEMKLRKHVKSLVVSEEMLDQVLFEGNLGQILELSMVDNRVLEVRGVNGVLRVDLTLEELEEMINEIRSRETSGSKLGSTTSTNI